MNRKMTFNRHLMKVVSLLLLCGICMLCSMDARALSKKLLSEPEEAVEFIGHVDGRNSR